MKDLVSVIIPFFNDSQTISRALESVIAQTYTNIEVLVVDDGSSTEEHAALEKIVSNYEKVRVIKRPHNRGAGFARNTGIAKAKGEYIAFLDADDEMYAHKIESQLKALRKSGAEAVLSDYHESENGKIKPSEITYEFFGLDGMNLDIPFGLRCGIQLVGMLFTREAVLRSQGFRTMYNGQDKDFFLRSLMDGTKWIYHKDHVGVRHFTPGSISSNEYKFLKRSCRRNVLLLAAHRLRKENRLHGKSAQILAEKIAIEARRWAHYNEWQIAKTRWQQAKSIHPKPRLHGTRLYKVLNRLLGFMMAERVRKWVGR